MYCSRCGKKVLDSMLFCPFCGAEIIIPEQDQAEPVARETAKAEPVKAEPIKSEPVVAEPVQAEPEEPVESIEVSPVFSFERPVEKEAPGGKAAPDIPDEKLRWDDLPSFDADPVLDADPEPAFDIDAAPEAKPEPKPEPEPEPPQTRETANAADVVPGRRSSDTLVPDKALVFDKDAMFMDDADDFDELDDEPDDFDAFEEELEREAERKRRREKKRRRYEEDDEDDDEPSFLARHIRSVVGLLMFLILLAILGYYALSPTGQKNLAKINATLPLRAEVYSEIAYDLYQSGDYAQSGIYYERALARDADNYNYASSAAMAYISGGDNDKAAEMLRKCVQLKPEAVEPYVYLLNLYPNANSRPWDVAQLLKQGYELTGDARLQEAASNGGAQE